MSVENSGLRSHALDDGDEGIPSMLQICTQLIKIINRMKKHAENCACCKDALEDKKEQ